MENFGEGVSFPPTVTSRTRYATTAQRRHRPSVARKERALTRGPGERVISVPLPPFHPSRNATVGPRQRRYRAADFACSASRAGYADSIVPRPIPSRDPLSRIHRCFASLKRDILCKIDDRRSDRASPPRSAPSRSARRKIEAVILIPLLDVGVGRVAQCRCDGRTERVDTRRLRIGVSVNLQIETANPATARFNDRLHNLNGGVIPRGLPEAFRGRPRSSRPA